MRLICPNCGAQYEVADDVIPPSGRDVQCSNCGHTWFEMPGASVAAEDAEPFAKPNQSPQVEPEAATKPDPVTPPQEQSAEQTNEDDASPEEELWDPPTPAAEPEEAQAEASAPPAQPGLDPDVASILREEAAYEQAARAAEAEPEPLETQTDFDLSPALDDPEQQQEARERLSRLRGETVPPATPDPDDRQSAQPQQTEPVEDSVSSRKDLLPDIEEINSSLRPDDPASAPAAVAAVAPSGSSGFRKGFATTVLFALVACAVYLFAPHIIAALPQAEPVITPYVEWVDGMRLWLNDQVQNLLAQYGGDG